jgi:hypothetical protein
MLDSSFYQVSALDFPPGFEDCTHPADLIARPTAEYRTGHEYYTTDVLISRVEVQLGSGEWATASFVVDTGYSRGLMLGAKAYAFFKAAGAIRTTGLGEYVLVNGVKVRVDRTPVTNRNLNVIGLAGIRAYALDITEMIFCKTPSLYT